MVFKNTSIEPSRTAAWTLPEMMVALTILATIIAGSVLSFSIYGSQSLAAIYNYTELDMQSQNALDRITKEVRQCTSFIDAMTTTWKGQTITNHIRFWQTNTSGNGVCLVLWYEPDTQRLLLRKRQRPGGGTVYSDTYILENCNYLNFSLYQRNTISNSFNQFPYRQSSNTMKLLLVNWVCQKRLVRSIYNTESVQSMRVVLRAAD